MSNPNKWLRMSVELATASTFGGFGKRGSKHGAIVVKNGQIVGVGVNSTRGIASVKKSEESWRSSYVHAEEVAIQAAGKKANGATLYVARVNRSGFPRLSEPCSRCEGVIARSGVRRVVYTVSDDKKKSYSAGDLRR